jgi:hypothetical protein
MLWLYILLNILGTDFERHFVPGLLWWVPDLGSRWMWPDMQQRGGYFLTFVWWHFDVLIAWYLYETILWISFVNLAFCHRIWKRQITTVRIANQNAEQFQQWKKWILPSVQSKSFTAL